MRTKLQENYSEWLKEKLKNSKGKHTSDDTFTPQYVYDYIIDWVFCHTRKADGLEICRPFYPGGDYEHEDYTGRVVIDNPPFSILSKIVEFYEENKIPYFVFGPTLQLLAVWRGQATNYIFGNGHNVTYENGVRVNTGFVSNLFDHKIMLMKDLVIPQQKKVSRRNKVEYPECYWNSARLDTLAHNTPYNYYIDDIEYTTKLPDGHPIYGGGIHIKEAPEWLQ